MRTLLVGLAAVLVSACDASSTSAPSIVDREGEPFVVLHAPDDPALSAAIADARRSVDAFISELPRLQADGAYVSVKAPVPTGTEIEHIWLSDLEYGDGVFHGRLGNEPLAPELSLGDPFSISPNEISDWMAVQNDELYGGFTVFVALAALDSGQRETFAATTGFRMPAAPKTF